VKVKKDFPQHAKRIMSHLWGFSQMSFTKSIITVDSNVEISDDETFVKYFLNHLDIRNDIVITQGIVDALDHASYQFAYGGKIGIDLTTKNEHEAGFYDQKEKTNWVINEEEIFQDLQKIFPLILQIKFYGIESLNKVLMIKVNKGNQGNLGKRVSEKIFALAIPVDIIIIFDEKNDLNDGHKLMWRIFNNCDWYRDSYFNSERNKIAIDCSSKNSEDGFTRRWPDDLIMSDTVIKKVDSLIND
jgi:4-hydroxy-3-polyprenylbenzoate decarboxylase